MAAEQDPWHFPRPGLAIGLLDGLGRGLTSARGLFAPRRMGKTEFLLQDLVPAARGAGVLAAYANLWDNRSDPARALLEAIGAEIKPGLIRRLVRDLQTPIKSLKVSGKVPALGEAALEASLDGPSEANTPISALSALLQEFDRANRTLLLLVDEAQVLAQARHADFSHALRAALDVRKQTIKVVFTGSSEATLRRMFARRSEPFFNWAPLEPFELLGRPFVYAMVEKVNATTRFPLGANDALHAFEGLQYTPEFFRRYLDRYLANPTAGSDAALRHTREHLFDGSDFDLTWQSLSPTDREVILMMSEGVSDLHSLSSRVRLAKALGRSEPVALSAPQHALKRLQSRGLVARIAQGEYQFEDAEFALWLRERDRASEQQ